MELNMKKKLLCCALLAGMSIAHSAAAQDYDDRWYISAGTGVFMGDNDRHVDDKPYVEVGLGKFVTKNISIDAALWYSNPEIDGTDNRNWELTSLSIVGRYHFVHDGRRWNPYLAAGLGAQHHRDETLTFLSSRRTGTDVTALFGGGIQADIGYAYLRAELGVRYDNDDAQFLNNNSFLDRYFGVSFLFPLGDEAAPAAEPTPTPQKTCADLDDDGDGVNNCNDKCPGSQAGQAIGPDGCPVPLTIDLKGVNFDFDKSTLRPDAVAILDEAISILGKYPQLRVEVAGHTDSIGTEVYNQGLSERRAQAVYDYLTGHGIDAGRLVGPTGYGETRPIAPNTNEDGSDNPEGRARNRRTELNVQN
jgi:OOP family OmpA-OmpF porin